MNALGGSALAVARDVLVELAPMLRRAVDLDAACRVRLRIHAGRVTGFIRLPFAVLVARTVPAAPHTAPVDTTVGAAELLRTLAEKSSDWPAVRDGDWRGTLPPAQGWRRLDSVPDAIVRDLVAKGAHALRELAGREGIPGVRPAAGVTDALLNSVVLTIDDAQGHDGSQPHDGGQAPDADPRSRSPDRGRTAASAVPAAEVTLRTLSALTRMGFLARDSCAHVDTAGRWTRVAATYGSVFTERAGLGLLG